jgi:hypothetical protein
MCCIYAKQELLSHRGLGARAQRESCGLDQRVARRQLCERLDYATVEQAVFSACPMLTSHSNSTSYHVTCFPCLRRRHTTVRFP